MARRPQCRHFIEEPRCVERFARRREGRALLELFGRRLVPWRDDRWACVDDRGRRGLRRPSVAATQARRMPRCTNTSPMRVLRDAWLVSASVSPRVCSAVVSPPPKTSLSRSLQGVSHPLFPTSSMPPGVALSYALRARASGARRRASTCDSRSCPAGTRTGRGLAD